MLTRLRLKNWRSVKEETIDFTTPITVFIGANSSGKTNIIDALYFLKRMIKENSPQSTFDNTVGALTIGTRPTEPIEFEITYFVPDSDSNVDYRLWIETNKQSTHFNERAFNSATNLLAEGRDGHGAVSGGGIGLEDDSGRLLLPVLSVLSGIATFRDVDTDIVRSASFRQLQQFIQTRWQFIGEFIEPPVQSSNSEEASRYEMDRKAANMLHILTFMSQQHHNLYEQFQDDLVWLLQQIKGIEVESDAAQIRLAIKEGDHVAPTVSSGTRRLLAILTAYYALDTRDAELPGLLVVEEPDTALNPGLLQRFVGQLRNYTEREGHPRQFVLTTHNPAFLDFFEPEEVRVVERDEQGYTHVRKIPDYIKDIWLDKYALGEVWTTNSFGGLPE